MIFNKKSYNFLLTYIKDFKFSLILILVLSLSLNFIYIFKPIIMGKILDIYTKDGLKEEIVKYIIYYSIFLFFNFTLYYTLILKVGITSQKILYKIRENVFDFVMRLKISFFDKNETGKIVTRITNDTEAINTLFTDVLIVIIKDFFLILFTLVGIFFINFKLALIIILFMPLIVFIIVYFKRLSKRIFDNIRESISKINIFLSETFTGFKIIELFNLQKLKVDRFNKIINNFRKESLKAMFSFNIFRPLVFFVSQLMLAFILYNSAKQYISGAISIGVIYVFMQYLNYLFDPLIEIAEKINQFQSGLSAVEKIMSVYDEKLEFDVNSDINLNINSNIVETEEKNSLEYTNSSFNNFRFAISEKKDVLEYSNSGGLEHSISNNFPLIEFRNVYFAYEGEKWILKDFSLTINEGETIAIVGPTGAGKTTIINILLRFYEIQKGEILIKGKNIKNYSTCQLREMIGIVLQDNFLFSGTILKNIKLFEEDYNMEKIIESSKYMNSYELIERKENKFNYEINQRGTTLSNGERQLICLTRAFYFNKPILILDEATANIDPHTDQLIQDALQKIMNKQTVIVIAHRLSTIKNANKIIFIKKGEIAESGTHNELIAKKGLYFELYEKQFMKV